MMRTSVQQILDDAGALALPGIYDTLSAKLAEQAGFPLGFVSGYSVAATFIGEPDLGIQVKVYELHRDTRFARVADQARMKPYMDHIYLPGQIIEFPTKKGQVYVVSKEIPWISNIPVVDA